MKNCIQRINYRKKYNKFALNSAFNNPDNISIAQISLYCQK
jgi:hypothetical protein